MTRPSAMLSTATFTRHPLHGSDRIWPESNCYVDLWIELLHSRGLEPAAGLAFTLAVDVEGDQWTFSKYPLADLYALYGVDVIELNVWRPLAEHLEEQLAIGRTPIVEVDAFYLADTVGTSHHAEHVKTSIAIQSLDRSRRRLAYFHNAGFYELEGRDVTGLLDLDGSNPPHLPPYIEVAKFGAGHSNDGRGLVDVSLDTLRHHLGRRPHDNPFLRYEKRLPEDLERLAAGTLEEFHGSAFATFRQCGAAFELAGVYLRWLEAHGERGLGSVAAACDTIASTAKALQFKAARLVHNRRPFDPTPMIETMASAWDDTSRGLAARYGAVACTA